MFNGVLPGVMRGVLSVVASVGLTVATVKVVGRDEILLVGVRVAATVGVLMVVEASVVDVDAEVKTDIAGVVEGDEDTEMIGAGSATISA